MGERSRLVRASAIVVLVMLIASGIAGLHAIGKADAAGRFTLTGYVSESGSSPTIYLAGAKVEILDLGKSAISGANGYYSISNVPAGSAYTVKASCAGYQDSTVYPVVVDAKHNTLSVPLVKIPQWLVMVYIWGDYGDVPDDSSTFEYAVAPFETVIGTTSDVKLVYLVDVIYNWPDGVDAGARIFEVTNHQSVFKRSLGEVDQGDPSVMQDFLTWSETNYPASKRALIITGGHGGPVVGLGWDEHTPEVPVGAYSYLSISELREAMANTKQETGNLIDTVMLDACTLQLLENCAEFEGVANVVVASEDVGLWTPLQQIAEGLLAAPSMDSSGLGSLMVEKYGWFQETQTGGGGGPSAMYTMSAVDVNKIAAICGDLAELGNRLQSYMVTNRADIDSCRLVVQQYMPRSILDSPDNLVDLYNLTEVLTARLILNGAPLDDAFLLFLEVMRVDIASAVVAEAHNVYNDAGSHGIALYFPGYPPDSIASSPIDQGYSGYRLVRTSPAFSWYLFLETYLHCLDYWDMSTTNAGKLDDIADSLGTSDGLIHSATPNANGRIGGCYDFYSVYGGVNSNIECPHNQYMGGEDLTAMAWIRSTYKDRAQCVMNKLRFDVYGGGFRGWELAVQPGLGPSVPPMQYDGLMLFAGTGDASDCWISAAQTVQHNLLDGDWHNVAVTVQGTSVRFYYDGVWDGIEKQAPKPLAITGDPLIIGNDDTTWTSPTQIPFLGSIDEVRHMNWAMNAEMVAWMSEAPPTTPGVPTVAAGDEQDGTYTVTWTSSSDSDLTPLAGYWLEESKNGGPWGTVGRLQGNSILVVRNEGSYVYRVCAYDSARPVSYSQWTVLSRLVDVPHLPTPPTTTATLTGIPGSNGWYRSAVMVTLAPTDIDPILATYYKIDSAPSYSTYDSPLNVTAEGKHTIYYFSVDTAGASETVKSIAAWLDTVAPATTAASNARKLTVTLSATDASSGIAATFYWVDSGPMLTYSGQFKLTRGTHTVYYYSVDNAGNQEATKSTVVNF